MARAGTVVVVDEDPIAAEVTQDTVDHLLHELRLGGFELGVHDGRLRIRPIDRVSPRLRARLIHHRTALLARLAPPRGFVTLLPDRRTGAALTLPVEVVEVRNGLEQRGFRQTLDDRGDYHVEPEDALTAADRIAIARWRNHLAAIVLYEAAAPTCH